MDITGNFKDKRLQAITKLLLNQPLVTKMLLLEITQIVIAYKSCSFNLMFLQNKTFRHELCDSLLAV